MPRVALIDGDILVYMAAAASETPIRWDDEWWMYLADEKQACIHFDSFVSDIEESLKADRVVVALSHEHSFRKDIYPDYKANRAGNRPPLCRGVVKQFAIDNYETWMRPGLEGDDVLGILATAKQAIPGEKIIVSIDKDMRTIPGLHLNWNHANHAIKAGMISSFEDAVVEVSEGGADYFHLLQTLAGDPTDGYPGCPGIGMQTADNILQQEPHVLVEQDHVVTRGKNKGNVEKRWVPEYGDFTKWETIVSYYRKAGLTEDHALTQARVARILRASDYDFKKKEPILWTP